MEKEKQREMAQEFVQAIETIESIMEVFDSVCYRVEFEVGNCGMWTLKFIPQAPGAGPNT